MWAAVAGRHTLDFFYHVESVGHFGKYTVAPTVSAFRAEVKEIIVNQIDEKLCSSGMRIVGAGHRQGTTGIFQAIIGFIFYRRTGLFLRHARLKTAALDHKTI